jgi:hypothetical protein
LNAQKQVLIVSIQFFDLVRFKRLITKEMFGYCGEAPEPSRAHVEPCYVLGMASVMCFWPFLPGANLGPIVSPPTESFRIALTLSRREYPADTSSREVTSRGE